MWQEEGRKAESMMRVGFVGLGAMGLPMARRVSLLPGVALRVFDLDDVRVRMATSFASPANSLAELVGSADIILSVLPADRHVLSVAGTVASAQTKASYYVDFSTVSPKTIESVADRLRIEGVTTISASLTKGTQAAESGSLGLFVGAEDRCIPEDVLRLMRIMASDLRVLPGLGQPKALKLANNMVLGCIVTTVAETLTIGAVAGIEGCSLARSLADGGADSWALQHHIMRHLLYNDVGPGYFGTDYMAKDMRLFLEMATSFGEAAILASLASATYRGVRGLGLGEHYHPVVMRWLEKLLCDRQFSPAERPSAAPVETLGTLLAGVKAVQVLTSYSAFSVLAKAEFPAGDALGYLDIGSASNQGLEQALHLFDGQHPIPLTVTQDIERAIDFAEAWAVPAIMFEGGRQAAIQIGT